MDLMSGMKAAVGTADVTAGVADGSPGGRDPRATNEKYVMNRIAALLGTCEALIACSYTYFEAMSMRTPRRSCTRQGVALTNSRLVIICMIAVTTRLLLGLDCIHDVHTQCHDACP